MLKNAKMMLLVLLPDADFYTIFKGCILNNNTSTLLLLSLHERSLSPTLSSNSSSLPLISSIIADIAATATATSTSNRTANRSILL